jgi:glycosyltransferase involved in cell wall biosynthesis
MRRLLLVTHRSIDQPGGPAARWRAFVRYLPEHGWEVDVLSATAHASASEYDAGNSRAVAARARVMAHVGKLSEPAFRLAGLRPDAVPLSMAWIPRGALLVRRRIERSLPDVVLATGPPIAGLIAARAGVPARVPLVVEFRDLWAGNPAFDDGGRTLSRIEAWLLRDARRVVACTPEAVSDLRVRHPSLGARAVEIANGFDPAIVSIVAITKAHNGQPFTLLHSGTLTPARPLAPLIHALDDPRVAGDFRLVLHGYLTPGSRAEVERASRETRVPIEVLRPSPWQEAVARIAGADAGLITQARAAGDETAVASKIYEYLALGKPVLCVTDGGASEALLQRLGGDDLCARLDAPETIVAALRRLRDGALRAPLLDRVQRYSRRTLAGRMAALLEEVVCESSAPRRVSDSPVSDSTATTSAEA